MSNSPSFLSFLRNFNCLFFRLSAIVNYVMIFVKSNVLIEHFNSVRRMLDSDEISSAIVVSKVSLFPTGCSNTVNLYQTRLNFINNHIRPLGLHYA